jgi:hypothetical protein
MAMSLSKALSGLRPLASGLLMAAVAAQATVPIRAQSPPLGELARKEQERRKTIKAAGKVYSNKDLPNPPEPAASAPGTLPPPTSTAPATTPEAPKAEQKDEKDEAYWRGRMAQAREAQRRAESFAEALQSRINALSNDAVNRDDPYQRAKAAEDRQKALSELARVTAEIADAKKEIAAIEEEARRGGVPPGWLR